MLLQQPRQGQTDDHHQGWREAWTHSSTDRVGQGGGVKADTTYRLPDGDPVHVGSEPAERKVIVRT